MCRGWQQPAECTSRFGCTLKLSESPAVWGNKSEVSSVAGLAFTFQIHQNNWQLRMRNVEANKKTIQTRSELIPKKVTRHGNSPLGDYPPISDVGFCQECFIFLDILFLYFAGDNMM